MKSIDYGFCFPLRSNKWCMLVVGIWARVGKVIFYDAYYALWHISHKVVCLSNDGLAPVQATEGPIVPVKLCASVRLACVPPCTSPTIPPQLGNLESSKDPNSATFQTRKQHQQQNQQPTHPYHQVYIQSSYPPQLPPQIPSETKRHRATAVPFPTPLQRRWSTP